MNVADTRVLLIGSLPFNNAEESFRAVGQSLSGQIGWIPDGEFGERKNWVAMLPEFVFSKHPDLEETLAPPTRTVEKPPVSDLPPPTDTDGFWNFRVKPGRRLRFDDLLYGRFAVDSYGVFRRLRDEGVIPSTARFQICLPSPHSAIDPYFDDPDQWPAVYDAYLDGLRREITKILDAAPATDLVFQWDLANEFVNLGMGEANVMKWWPKLSIEEKFERHASQLGTLGGAIPEGALLGFHWCYGTWGGWPSVAMKDLEFCVRMSNEAVRHVDRHVDYVHMPVVRQPDEAFFAPLDGLDIGDARVFLGIVHHADAIDDFRRRRDLARKHLREFGIGSVCGYGRVEPEEAQGILALHAEDAKELHATLYAERRVNVGDHELRYVEAGDGQPLVWLHGGGGLHASTGIDLLTRSFRVVALEMPGFGSSLERDTASSFDELSEQVAEAIQALGLTEYVLHGTSFGGATALHLTLNHPDRVTRLILESPVAFRPPGWTPPDLETVRRGFYHHPERARRVEIDPAVQLRQRELVARLSLTVDRDALATRLRDLHVPILVIFGEADTLTPPGLAHMYCDHAPNCTSVLIRDAAHVISSDQPEAYARAVREFAVNQAA